MVATDFSVVGSIREQTVNSRVSVRKLLSQVQAIPAIGGLGEGAYILRHIAHI